MIVTVDETNLPAAGYIHSEAWKASHDFCAPEFVAQHTPQAQSEYLRREMEAGKKLFMLIADIPVGIVSIQGSLIENLYVLPEEQNRGHGTKLLRFAVEQCGGTPTLWILSSNEGARRLYLRNGFRQTGNRKQLKGDLYEMELSQPQTSEEEGKKELCI